MDMGEYLEELEDEFGSEVSTAAVKDEPINHKPDSTSAAAAKMSWLNANGIVPPVLPKKSRWGTDDSNVKTENIITTVTEKYYGKVAIPSVRAKKHQQPPSAQPLIPPPSFFPPPMMFMPSMPGIPPMPIPIPPMMAPPTSSSQRSSSPRRLAHSRSRSRSPVRRSTRSPHRRSPDLGDGISTADMTSEERRKFEENKIFVKLLLTKLLAIKSNRRLESLHVSLMTMVKRAVDEEETEQASEKAYRRSR